MMCSLNTFLIAYSSASTLVICVLSVVINHYGEPNSEETVAGNSNTVDKTEIGLFNFDNSEDDFMDGGEMSCNCGLLTIQWTVLEIIVAGMLGLAALYGLIKGITHFRNTLAERSEKKLEQLRTRIKKEMGSDVTEATTSSRPDKDTMELNVVSKQSNAEKIVYP
jgi:hypothetical protein